MEGSIGETTNEDTNAQTRTATKVQIVFRHLWSPPGKLLGGINISPQFQKEHKEDDRGNEIQEMLGFSSFHACLIEPPTISHLERHLKVVFLPLLLSSPRGLRLRFRGSQL